MTTKISIEESVSRKAAIDFARGSVRLEGVVLSSEIEAINQQYVDGHIDADTRRALSFAASEREFGVNLSVPESTKRKREVDFARGSVRLEGIILTPEIESINQQYIDGRIDSKAHTALCLAAVDREFGSIK
jgi:hypothetical protein